MEAGCQQKLLTPEEIRALVWQQAHRWLTRYYTSASVTRDCDLLVARFYYGMYYVDVEIRGERVEAVTITSINGEVLDRWRREWVEDEESRS